MISVYDLKPKFQAFLRPLCGSLVKLGVRANHVTLFAMFASIAYGVWMLIEHSNSYLALLLLPLFLFFRMALNAIDGMMAREFDQKSDLGFYLNEIGDIISDIFLYAPFLLYLSTTTIWVGLLQILVVIMIPIVEFSGLLSIGLGKVRRYDGPFGKSDRAVIFSIFGYLLAFELISIDAGRDVLSFFLLLSALTILIRCYKGLKA